MNGNHLMWKWSYSIFGTFSNHASQSRFQWTALPFGFAPRNPTLSLVSRFQATQKRLASIVAERGKADHARFYTPGFTRRPVRTEMGPHQVEHEEGIAELWEQL